MTIYIAFLVVMGVTNHEFGSLVSSDDDLSVRQGLSLNYTFIAFNSVLVVIEMLQFSRAPFKYVRSYINYVDLTAYALIYAASYYRTRDVSESDLSSSLISITIVMCWYKLTYFLRPFKSTGHLIGMIEGIAWEIRYFLLILALILFGFSQALYVLSQGDPDSDFGTASTAYVSAFNYMVGNSSFPLVGTSNPELATFLAVMLVVVTTILLLNLLISIMSNTYQKIQANADTEWRRKLCGIMIEQIRFYPPKLEPFLTYIKAQTDIELERMAEENDVAKRFNQVDKMVQDGQAKMSQLEEKLTEMQAQLSQVQLQTDSKLNILLDHFNLRSTAST